MKWSKKVLLEWIRRLQNRSIEEWKKKPKSAVLQNKSKGKTQACIQFSGRGNIYFSKIDTPQLCVLHLKNTTNILLWLCVIKMSSVWQQSYPLCDKELWSIGNVSQSSVSRGTTDTAADWSLPPSSSDHRRKVGSLNIVLQQTMRLEASLMIGHRVLVT